ncbi:uncharacterized protein LOC108738553 isoform X2 [Agrilus planipennis]|uniref:Uncharacterized protein LOC108738553 isoform X2 n=1 Tax=Agrilus planipennis TaxID=224129 RepID=A0A7F5RDD3_AGRPL|nr:uncharacterized protein LOC108738553 isoform X2 [Agrilus planipennis]
MFDLFYVFCDKIVPESVFLAPHSKTDGTIRFYVLFYITGPSQRLGNALHLLVISGKRLKERLKRQVWKRVYKKKKELHNLDRSLTDRLAISILGSTSCLKIIFPH